MWISILLASRSQEVPGKSDHDIGDLCLHNSSCSGACGSPLARSASEKNGLRSKMVCAAQRACLKNATSWLNHSRWYASMATNAAGTNWSPLADPGVYLHPDRFMSRDREKYSVLFMIPAFISEVVRYPAQRAQVGPIVPRQALWAAWEEHVQCTHESSLYKIATL